MTLEVVLNSRSVDAESKGKLLNLAELTLVNAASANNHAVRKGEFDTAVSDLNAAISAVHGAHAVHVDTTSADLATSLAGATFAVDAWAFGATELHVGDVLVLDAATEQDSDRAWIMVAANGVAADFKAFGSDVNAAINTARDAAISTIRNGSGYSDLADAEIAVADVVADVATNTAAISSANTAIAAKADTNHYSVVWGAADGDGVREALIDITGDFASHDISVRVLKEKAGGFYEHITSGSLVIETSDAAIRLRSDSISLTNATLHVVVIG
jgi:hypothetical protein